MTALLALVEPLQLSTSAVEVGYGTISVRQGLDPATLVAPGPVLI